MFSAGAHPGRRLFGRRKCGRRRGRVRNRRREVGAETEKEEGADSCALVNSETGQLSNSHVLAIVVVF